MVEQSDDDTTLRQMISEKLADGFETEVFPRAETSEMGLQISEKLRLDAAEDLDQKLKIGGFTNYTVEIDGFEQPCETCMYYLVHRKFCALPELMLPVEPEWSCRLWRI